MSRYMDAEEFEQLEKAEREKRRQGEERGKQSAK